MISSITFENTARVDLPLRNKDEKELGVIEKIERNLKLTLGILEYNSNIPSNNKDKRELLLQIWVLKKVVENTDLDKRLEERINLLYEDLDKEVFSSF